MKGNNGSGNIPERNEWETSKELFEQQTGAKIDFRILPVDAEENSSKQSYNKEKNRCILRTGKGIQVI